MSDTPETDAEIYPMNGVDIVWPEFSRRLERERDNAREKYATEATEHMLAVNKLANERDDLERELTNIYRWIERNHSDGFIDSLSYSQNLERVTDSWYDRLERVEREDAILGWENKWKCAVDMAARAELERDDAWEDAKLLSERLTALELQSTAELARLEQELINMKELHESNN